MCQSQKSVSKASWDPTFLVSLLSPPTLLPAATVSPHHCHCHCQHHAQYVATPQPALPVSKLGPWSFSCQLSGDMAVEQSGRSKPYSLTAGITAVCGYHTLFFRLLLFGSFPRTPSYSPEKNLARTKPWETGMSVNRRWEWMGIFIQTRLMGGPSTSGLESLKAA